MVILIRISKLTKVLIVFMLLILLIVGIYFWHQFSNASEVFIDEGLRSMLKAELQEIFENRGSFLLDEDREALKDLYNTEVRSGLYAYEHELTKMRYLHMWSKKQAVEFKSINSEVVVRGAKVKGEGYTVSLLVATEYSYSYENEPNKVNSFRIGTYHTLDLVPYKEKWAIAKEWYNDPFADSLHLDEIKSQEVRDIILIAESKDFSDLSEGRINAVKYAYKYSGAAALPEYGFQYNPDYRNYNSLGGDCANYASQILFEGGQFKKNTTWNYEKNKGSRAWINASSFNSYMLNSGRGSTIARGSYQQVLKASYSLLPGDYIAYEVKGKVTHISVITDADTKGYALVNSHNTDRHRVPWDLGWSDKGVVFRLVRVHYF